MLSVSFPLEMIGNPAQIEIAFMASPWTSSACDNLGQGANTTPCWISINTATPNSYSVIDNAGDMEWPVGLTPDRSANFDIVSVGITISKK
ncbi:hypothetical protein BMS3Abin03_02772 [bacterium BMS3Abin03]|nr:hypothetical protein BMS3Abin03_02772 [bacterium BMS3Abin03]